MIIEVVRFKTKAGVSEDALLAASRIGTREFFAKQPGFLNREMARSREGEWVDIVHWQSMQAAEDDERIFFGNKITQEFMQMIDLTTVRVERWEVAQPSSR
jgi:hypothetical protein